MELEKDVAVQEIGHKLSQGCCGVGSAKQSNRLTLLGVFVFVLRFTV